MLRNLPPQRENEIVARKPVRLPANAELNYYRVCIIWNRSDLIWDQHGGGTKEWAEECGAQLLVYYSTQLAGKFQRVRTQSKVVIKKEGRTKQEANDGAPMMIKKTVAIKLLQAV